MKKLLSLLLLVCSLSVSATVKQTVTFDFTSPTTLDCNPPITQQSLGNTNTVGIKLQITDRTINCGPVSITFSKPGGTGASIHYDGEDYRLSLGLSADITFKVSGGCSLSSITFDQISELRKLNYDDPGDFSGKVWSAGDSKPTEITLHNGSDYSFFYQIVVEYNTPATPLNFQTSTPNDNTTVAAFNKMTLYFNTSVVEVRNGNVQLTGGSLTSPKQMTAIANGSSTVELTLDATISEEGSYKVSVPEGIFATSEGATNSAFDINFTIVPKRDTFNPVDINPQDNSTLSRLPNTIKLTFPNYVKTGTGTVKFKSSDGASSFSANVAVDASDKKSILITHDYEELMAATWKVDIPEKAFHNDFPEDDVDFRWNEKKTLTYIVDGTEYNPGPQDSEIMTAAKDLLTKTGVGYPAKTSDAYKALEALVNAEETPDDTALQEAMNALYNEKNVEMPLLNQWYSIAGVNSTGKKIYLTFDETKTKVILGTNANNAAAFKVKSVEDGKVVFQTKEGFLLHVLTTLPMHEGTSSSNLTDADKESDINKLTLAKFAASSVEGAEPSALYGTFTIFGSLGKVNDTEEQAYALLNFENTSIATYAGTPLKYSATLSNAFMLTATTEPEETINYTHISVGLTSAVISEPGQPTILKVHGPTSTQIADKNKIYYTKDGFKVSFAEDILTPTETANQFNVNSNGLSKGTYFIVIEDGAFTFEVPTGTTPKIPTAGKFEVKLIIQSDGGSGGETPTSVTPTASLAPTSAINAGDALVLTIGKVKIATLTASGKPIYKNEIGETVTFSGTILTKKSDTEFNVNTTGLAAGKYTLVMPKGTFTYEVEGGTANDVELTAQFEIKANTPPVDTDDFQYVYSTFTTFYPASRYRDEVYMDVDLNDMIVYVDVAVADGMFADPNKEVKMVSTNGVLATTGHFETYTTFAQDYGSQFNGKHAVKFVPHKRIEAGDLDNWNGTYKCRCERGTLGDANFGKWLKGDKNIKKSDCTVNDLVYIGGIYIDNYEAITTGIDNVNVESGNQVIFDLQGRKVEHTGKGVYIVNGKKIYVK